MIFQIIFLFTLCPSPKPKIENKTFFIFKSIFNFDVINIFKQDLQRTNWKDIEAFTDPNESYKAFLERFLLLYDKYFPIRKIKIKAKHLESLWITNEIKKSSKKKQRLHQKFLGGKKKKEKKSEYKNCKKLFDLVKKLSKKLHFSRLIH